MKNNSITHKMHCMKSSIITHAVALLLFSLIVLLIYTTVHQTHRAAANAPKTALTSDVVNEFKSPILIKLLIME